MTNLPMEPLSMNLMRPLILAKSVSSLPRPTFRPGLTRVPRWRTMMVPPGTTCPPKALKPNRCALESRPFRELPRPFLCAMDFQFPVSGFLFQIQLRPQAGGQDARRTAGETPALLFLFRRRLLGRCFSGCCFLCRTFRRFRLDFGFVFYLDRLDLLWWFCFFLREVGGGEFLAVVGDLGDADRGISLAMSTQFLVLLFAFVM